MHVSTIFSDMSFPPTEGLGYTAPISCPTMDIHFNPTDCNTGYFGDKVGGRTIRIIKLAPECQRHGGNHIDSKCFSAFCVSFHGTKEECEALKGQIQFVPSRGSCDSVTYDPRYHMLQFQCSIARANLVLSSIAFYLKDIFRKPVLLKAQQFIYSELNIHEVLGKQPGAMKLVSDLREKPFSEEVAMVLIRLLNGIYAKNNTRLFEDLTAFGFKDLAAKHSVGLYDHAGEILY